MNKTIIFKNILELDDEYIEKLRQWRNQDFVREKMFNQQIITKEDHKNFIQMLNNRMDKQGFISFYNDKPFGVLNFDIYKDNTLEFGYYLIDEKFISSGLGVILEYVLLNHALYNLKVHRVFCRTLYFNRKVIELHSKFGFLSEERTIEIGGSSKEIIYQTIDVKSWERKKTTIEKLINYIIPLDKIDGLR